MADATDNSAWHPAAMPNAHGHGHSQQPDSQATTQSSSFEIVSDIPSQDQAEVLVPQSLPPSHDAHDHEGASSHDEDHHGGAGLEVEDPGLHHKYPEEVLEASSTEAAAENAEPLVENTPKPESRPKHSSSMSFARTVSHDISFNDDDDGDWSLPRSDTDPFKFMSPSDRTNSFPTVPLLDSTVEDHSESPLPANQALDVLEETERDLDFEAEQYNAGNKSGGVGAIEAEGQASMLSKHTPSQSIGGEIHWAEDEDSEARFTEGVPLIPHSGDSLDHGTVGTAHGRAGVSFDDNNDDDDFFGQSHEAEGPFASAGSVPNLDRKSTMQVLAAADSGTDDVDGEEGLEAVEQQSEIAVAAAPDVKHSQAHDLSSKWQEAFAGDDDDGDFLLDDTADTKDLDAAAFLGSDDEGLLDDADDADNSTQLTTATSQPVDVTPKPAYSTGSYVPAQAQNAYMAQAPQAPYHPYQQPPTQGPTPSYGQVPVQQLEATKAQSFADRTKGGYSSPYDLPTDLLANSVKPRKRASMQQLSQENTMQPPPPPRSASLSTGLSPTSPSGAQQKPLGPPLRNKDSFFEDLPILPKPRPNSRQSNRAASPSPYTPLGQSPHGPSPLGPPMIAHTASTTPAAPPVTPSGMSNLVAPERVSPYASLQSSIPPLPPTNSGTARYSPAPTQTSSAPPPAASSRYSPAPPAVRANSSYNAAVPANVSQPILPHLPRTSSPLAHFEMSSDKGHTVNSNGEAPHHPERRASSSYEGRVTRVPSLPPTREVEEEEDQASESRNASLTYSPPGPPTATSRYSPAPMARRTPPPTSSENQLLSPKRPGSSYAPQAPPPAQPGFVPPPRAQTQSPGATRGVSHVSKLSDPAIRPISSHSPTSPAVVKSTPYTHQRAPSLPMDIVAPTDGREHDPLQRWQGVPIISWGVGGTIVTTFPKNIPRYVMNKTTASILRTPGEVKVRNIKDIGPLQERLAKFPGPLKGKSKKKEVLTWLSSGIETLEKELPDVPFHTQLSLEAKRGIERVLLWKLLRVFIEFDGVLEGTPAVDKAVRDILSPNTMTPTAENDGMFPETGFGLQTTALTAMQGDGADSSAMEKIRHDLLKGDSEAAVWAAVDKRLWGHAMLIAISVSHELYKRVAQEFVRKEVNHPGHSNESIAAFYKILSGNHDDCVDELVPMHARAGLQLISTDPSSGTTKQSADGLEKWRETLTLVLSNRSAEDVRGLNALGKLLSGYGRAEAAHICFMFSRNVSLFGGLDELNADYVLLGSDHRKQGHQFAEDTEALQLSEVYEYGLSLSGAPNAAAGAPHLAAYKLHHAITLAEHGYRDKALQYCDMISTTMVSQTRRSPYHHAILDSAVEDFMRRLKQAPKEESSSWISKPSMNKVSDSMWNRFNKFVAGDEQDNTENGAEAENGPFARIATTPTMSRSPSVSNFETFSSVTSPNYTTSNPIPTSAVSSRYAPQAQASSSLPNSFDSGSPYAPSSLPPGGQNLNGYGHSPYEPSPLGNAPILTQSQGYIPSGVTSSNSGYQPHDAQVTSNPYQPYGAQENSVTSPKSVDDKITSQSQGYNPGSISYGYQPPTLVNAVPEEAATNKVDEGESGGYVPPSYEPYGYEPPSYEPDAEPSAEDDDAPKPKKKSFMDDDEDEFSTSQPQEKSKAEKDRENEEMFRKAAEEDAKRAAAQAASKKGWGFTGWFGGGAKKEPAAVGEASPNKPIKAKLGEASSFVYDPELKRWINKKSGAENVEAKSATPPPPRSTPRSVSGTPPPRAFTPPPAVGRSSVPPPATGGLAPPPTLNRAISQESIGSAPPMIRSVSGNSVGPPSRPPSRPTTSMSNASSIEDLLSTSAPRKAGAKKARKGGRYVDVMAK